MLRSGSFGPCGRPKAILLAEARTGSQPANDRRHTNDGGQCRRSLRLTEERLRLAEETAGIGVFDLDLTSDAWVTTPHVAVLFGFAPHAG